MLTFGFDISTNCTGYAVVNEKRELLKSGFIDTSKEKLFYRKVDEFSNQIDQLHKEFSVEQIGIEDVLNKFIAGKSSIKTIGSLIGFNKTASYLLYKKFIIAPVHINVLRARSLAMGHSVPRGQESKEYILNKVKEWYPDIELPMMKRAPRLAKQAYDICDSVIVAIAMLSYEVQNE